MHRLSEPIAPVQQMAVKPLKRIAPKSRKYGGLQDKSWEEVLRENLESKEGICEASDERDEPRNLAREALSEKKASVSESTAPQEWELSCDAMIAEIRKMADSPEQLVDSHMGIMMEPVQSGKWVNAAG